jgi:hypothetical protein
MRGSRAQPSLRLFALRPHAQLFSTNRQTRRRPPTAAALRRLTAPRPRRRCRTVLRRAVGYARRLSLAARYKNAG